MLTFIHFLNINKLGGGGYMYIEVLILNKTAFWAKLMQFLSV